MRPAVLAVAAVSLALAAGGALAQPLTLCKTPAGRLVPCNNLVAPVIPSGATARCKDGTFSFNRHLSDACSRHGGVAQRYE